MSHPPNLLALLLNGAYPPAWTFPATPLAANHATTPPHVCALYAPRGPLVKPAERAPEPNEKLIRLRNEFVRDYQLHWRGALAECSEEANEEEARKGELKRLPEREIARVQRVIKRRGVEKMGKRVGGEEEAGQDERKLNTAEHRVRESRQMGGWEV